MVHIAAAAVDPRSASERKNNIEYSHAPVDLSRYDLRWRNGRDDFKLRHHPIVLMLQDVTMEHVFSKVIGEFHFELKRFAGTQRPSLFHCFVRITWAAVTAKTLLIHVVYVDHVCNFCRI